MKLFRNIFLILLTFFTLLTPKRVLAAEKPLNIYFFYRPGCPHCEKEEELLKEIKNQKGDLVEIVGLDITKESGEQALKALGKEYSLDVTGTPRTLIGENFVRGYLNYETQGLVITKAIDECLNENVECKDIVAPILDTQEKGQSKPTAKDLTPVFETIKLPFIGNINPQKFSLPMLTFIIALIDGFNPCAMWALIFLISLLLKLNDPKRRIILGSVFIFSSALMYFLFLSAWLNTFIFVGLVRWVQIIIALVALGAGLWSIRDFFVNKSGGCNAEESEKKQAMFTRMKKLVQEPRFITALLGIAALAFAVNLVELFCSAGLPAIYTQVLALSNLPNFQYYAYLIFYVFIFMLDDLVVFLVAMKTLQLVGIESKYARYSRLIGGVVMLIISALLVLKPGMLMLS